MISCCAVLLPYYLRISSNHPLAWFLPRCSPVSVTDHWVHQSVSLFSILFSFSVNYTFLFSFPSSVSPFLLHFLSLIAPSLMYEPFSYRHSSFFIPPLFFLTAAYFFWGDFLLSLTSLLPCMLHFLPPSLINFSILPSIPLSSPFLLSCSHTFFFFLHFLYILSLSIHLSLSACCQCRFSSALCELVSIVTFQSGSPQRH